MAYRTIQDVVRAAGERFQVPLTTGLERAVHNAAVGRSLDELVLDDSFLRDVWNGWHPEKEYPF